MPVFSVRRPQVIFVLSIGDYWDYMKEVIFHDHRGDLGKVEILISFIVPVYNTEGVLEETLDSIARVASEKIELIIVDDGSTDGSASKISDWIDEHSLPVLHVYQNNLGPSGARMTGLRHARGEYVGFCDSDDRLDVSTYLEMAEIGSREDCDIALCRSVVFDSASEEVHDFYDAWLWEKILHGRHSVIVNALREPTIFRLEPNTNTRLIRREFISEKNIAFPLGLHLGEDFPTHVDSLAAATKILLLDRTGYFYRVNRAGKLTYQKSEARFDMLQSAALAFDAMKQRHVDIQGAANVVAMATRMIYWCGMNTLNKDRRSFFSKACKLFVEEVTDGVAAHCINSCLDDRESVQLAALKTGSVPFLVAYSSRRLVSPRHVIPMLVSKCCGRRIRRIAKRVAIDWLRIHFRKIVFVH